MLELRASCECCDRDLPNGSPDARICTYECTFCAAGRIREPGRAAARCLSRALPAAV